MTTTTTANDSIQLVIRCTNNKYADFTLQLSPTSTVYELKQQVAVVHPTKPIPRDQRLIFAGKLLDEANLLNQVFIKPASGSSFMVHLVLDADKNVSPSRTPSQPQVAPVPVVSTPAPEVRPTPTHSATYEHYLDELNKYQYQLQQFISNPSGASPVLNAQAQAYLQYCQTHYQMYQNLFAHQRSVHVPSPPQPSPPSTTNTPTSAVPPPAAPAAAPPAPPAANNNNELEPENDLLGVLNMLAELFILCSIIYFYSTFNRFLVVFVIFALLFLHCRGYLTLQRRRPAPVQPLVPPAEPAARNDGDDEVEPGANDAQNDIQRPTPVAPQSGPAADNPITATRLVLTAVSTFFSSLIPERPQRT